MCFEIDPERTVDRDVRFLAGTVYRRQVDSDEPEFRDYSFSGDWVCPIHFYIDGRLFGFILDAVMSDQHLHAKALVAAKADAIAAALTLAAHDPAWRATYLRPTVFGAK